MRGNKRLYRVVVGVALATLACAAFLVWRLTIYVPESNAVWTRRVPGSGGVIVSDGRTLLLATRGDNMPRVLRLDARTGQMRSELGVGAATGPLGDRSCLRSPLVFADEFYPAVTIAGLDGRGSNRIYFPVDGVQQIFRVRCHLVLQTEHELIGVSLPEPRVRWRAPIPPGCTTILPNDQTRDAIALACEDRTLRVLRAEDGARVGRYPLACSEAILDAHSDARHGDALRCGRFRDVHVHAGYVLGHERSGHRFTVLLAPNGRRTSSRNNAFLVWSTDRWIVATTFPDVERGIRWRAYRPSGELVHTSEATFTVFDTGDLSIEGDSVFTPDDEGAIRRTILPAGSSERIGQRPVAARENRPWIREALDERPRGDQFERVSTAGGMVFVLYEGEIAAFPSP